MVLIINSYCNIESCIRIGADGGSHGAKRIFYLVFINSAQ
jgi:hypothetical protein